MIYRLRDRIRSWGEGIFRKRNNFIGFFKKSLKFQQDVFFWRDIFRNWYIFLVFSDFILAQNRKC